MSLPLLTCPACGAQQSLDAALGHQGARDALLSLANLHPSHARLQMTALRYVGLFAPAKQTMRLDRVASLLAELGGLIRAGKVEHKGRSWPAPLDYWLQGMEEMLAGRDRLRLPLANHNYLRAIVAGLGDRADHAAERQAEATARGVTPVGLPPPAPAPVAPPRPAPEPRREMPAEVKGFLAGFGKFKPSTPTANEGDPQ